MPRQVFISYATEDSATTTAVRNHLETEGIGCWMAPRDITPGLDYGGQIIDAIEGCTVVVLVLSESSNRSRFVLNEVERAVSKNKIIIPLCIHDVQPSRSLEFFISNAQWINAGQTPLESQVEVLATAIRNYLDQSSVSPMVDGVPAPPVTFAAAPSPTHLPANRRSNLPVHSTPFVGRETELAEISHRLADPACRLLTLAGYGGIGKTRLSLEVAARILAEGSLVPDGVFFVSLDTVSTPEQIPFAIAQSLDLAFASQREARELLLGYLAPKQLLLVLDNFEHLLEGAELVSDILTAAPTVKILATSREALNLQEEWFHPIGGLDLPPEGATPEQVLASAAVQLFALCAHKARNSFHLEAEITHVIQLCRLLDGTPLALELAAAWLRSLTCAQVVQELQNSLELLATSLRNVPQRHRSMEAVFRHSWELLAQRERDVLCQLAVFEGGFDWAAAKSVSGVSVTMLTRLVESSWVHVSEEGRYELVPLVRSYLLARLENDYPSSAHERPDQVRDRHSRHYAAQMRNTTHVQREQDVANLRSAWRHALSQFDGESFLQFVTQMLSGLLIRKGWADSYQETEELLGAAERRIRSEMSGKEITVNGNEIHRALAELLFQRAVTCNRVGLSRKAEALCREGLAALEQMSAQDDRAMLRIQAVDVLAWILIHQSRLLEADEAARQVLTESPVEGWEYQSSALHYLAYSAEEQGRYAEAESYLRRALELLPADKEGDFINFILMSRFGTVSYMVGAYLQAAQWLARATEIVHTAPRLQRLEHQVFWARLEIAVGNLDSARTRCLTVLPKAREHGVKIVQIIALGELGRIALAEGRYDEAEAYFREAKQVAEQIGRSKEIVKAAIGLGNVALARGILPTAAAHFRHALSIAWPLAILPDSIVAVVGLAGVEAQTGNRQQAVSWLSMATQHTATPHHVRLQAEVMLANLDENKEVGTDRLEDIVATALTFAK